MEVTERQQEELAAKKVEVIKLLEKARNEVSEKYREGKLVGKDKSARKHEAAIRKIFLRALNFEYQVFVSFEVEGKYNFSIVTPSSRMSVLDSHILLD
jgi:hypothetical protein